jgi:hypothetical protein
MTALSLRSRALRAARHISYAVGLLGLVVGHGAAQQRIIGPTTTVHVSPAYEHWSFATPLPQPTVGGTGSVHLDGASQFSFPVLAEATLSENWTADLSTAFVSGSVTLSQADANQKDSYSVSGLTDTKLRLTGRVMGDNVVVTVGLNVPTGATNLEPNELNALRVIAAPALGFQIPVLGTGGGGTAGVILARQTTNFALAFGAAYELRRGYAPVVLVSGIPAPDFNPGDVFHVSVGADGTVGEHRLNASLSTDLFSEDRLSSDGNSAPATTHLGPIVTAEAKLDIATHVLRELSVFASERYRTSYKRDGITVPQSSANYFEIGALGVKSIAPRTDASLELSVRTQSGFKADSAMATAAMSGFGASAGVTHQLQSGYLVQPFLRLRKATIKNGSVSSGASGFSIGVTVSKRF